MMTIIYPEWRQVSEQWIRQRYADLVTTEFMNRENLDSIEPAHAQQIDAFWLDAKNNTDLQEAKQALEDAGVVTFSF